MVKLSKKTEILLNDFFPKTLREEAKEWIEIKCGRNLLFCENSGPEQMERIRFSAIKLSEGQIDKLSDAIELAQTDWRDLLMSAGFGYDPEKHNQWYNNRFSGKPW